MTDIASARPTAVRVSKALTAPAHPLLASALATRGQPDLTGASATSTVQITLGNQALPNFVATGCYKDDASVNPTAIRRRREPR